MVIVDTALRAREEQGRPIRAALLGAGFMARGVANHLVNTTRGIRLAAICARRVEEAFHPGKPVILMNAELDATLGPILQVYARRRGVLLSACDGDQPGVEINLFRFVRGLGLVPRVLGNIKGLQDRYRTPATQKAFAERWGQKPAMVTSFADGSKVNFEQAVVANATGMRVARRGMLGRDHHGHSRPHLRRRRAAARPPGGPPVMRSS